MKKLILGSLIAILALTMSMPVLAAGSETASTTGPTLGQQLKEFANVELVYTNEGVTINLTGTTIGYSFKLVNIYFANLFKRSIEFGSNANLTITQYPNGFSVNIGSTDPEIVYTIQKTFMEMNSLTKLKIPLVQLLASYGIK